VLFNNGLNEMVAIGYNSSGECCRDSMTLNYSSDKAGKPERIDLSYSRLANGHLLIEALIVDENGCRCIDYNKRIYFSSDGSGQLLRDYGTYTRSDIIEAANGRAVIEFVLVPGEEAIVECRNQDFKGSYLRIKN